MDNITNIKTVDDLVIVAADLHTKGVGVLFGDSQATRVFLRMVPPLSQKKADEVYNLETNLAKASRKLADLRDPYNFPAQKSPTKQLIIKQKRAASSSGSFTCLMVE